MAPEFVMLEPFVQTADNLEEGREYKSEKYAWCFSELPPQSAPFSTTPTFISVSTRQSQNTRIDFLPPANEPGTSL